MEKLFLRYLYVIQQHGVKKTKLSFYIFVCVHILLYF